MNNLSIKNATITIDTTETLKHFLNILETSGFKSEITNSNIIIKEIEIVYPENPMLFINDNKIYYGVDALDWFKPESIQGVDKFEYDKTTGILILYYRCKKTLDLFAERWIWTGVHPLPWKNLA